MYMNKKNSIFSCIIFSICFLWNILEVQGQLKENKITTEVKNFEKKDDNLLVNVDFVYDNLQLKKHEQLILKPVLKTEQNILELPPVVINGKKRYKVYLRQQAFKKTPELSNATVIKFNKKNKQDRIPYSVTIPFEEWMNTASLYLKESGCPGCGATRTDISEQFISQLNSDTIEQILVLNPLVTFVMPVEDNHSKIRVNKESAYLKFPSGSSQINPSFKDNAIELEKVNNKFQDIIHDELISISKISIEGLSSIEGTYKLNMVLSENRAKAFETYIRERYDFPLYLFETGWIGEDWDGLRSLVENGDIQQKEAILRIINSIEVFDGREKKLMLLNGGNPYRYMLANYFPLLRKVNYTIEYTVKSFSNEESTEIIKTKPHYLSPRELYILAEKYEKLSDEFKEIMDMSVSNYPLDNVVNINAAATYILRSKYDVAEHYLMSAGNSAPTFNNRGVLLMMKGKYDEAEEILLKAKQLGSQDAEHNLQELEKVRKKISQ